MWIWLIIVAAVIGGIIGMASSKDDDRGAGCLGGAFTGAAGCGYILFQIFLVGLAVSLFVWLFT